MTTTQKREYGIVGSAVAKDAVKRELFRKYIAQKRVLIVDRSSVSRVRLSHELVELGADLTRIALAETYDAAIAEMKRLKPAIVLTEYHLGNRLGIELLREVPRAADSLHVIVSGSSRQSIVAHAADEDVDALIIKPFSKGALAAALVNSAMKFLAPSAYIEMISSGRERLAADQLDEAINRFGKAVTLDTKPSLACAYLGQALVRYGSLVEARQAFERGLSHDPIHLKCLTGLYELLVTQPGTGNKLLAYETLKKLIRYFPATSKRVMALVQLAIHTKNFEDVEGFYRSFRELARDGVAELPAEAMKHLGAALVICGKWRIEREDFAPAMRDFEEAIEIAGNRPVFLRQIVESLVRAGASDQAKAFLGCFEAIDRQGADYVECKRLIDAGKLLEN